VPPARTLHQDLLVLNTAQFVSNTLNNNEVIRSVEQFLADHADQFAVDPPQPASTGVPQVAAA
jgi:hypothetical protein